MPPLPYVNAVVKVVLSGPVGDSSWANVLHYEYNGTPPLSNTAAQSVATAIHSAWVSNLKVRYATFVQLTKIAVTDLTSATAGYGEWVGSEAGTGDSTPSPANTCVLIRKQILRRYRGSHPRIYFPTVGGTNIADDDNWKTTYTSALLSSWQAFDAALLAISVPPNSQFSPVNISYYEGFTNYTRPSGRQDNKPALRATPIVDSVIGYAVLAKMATQRKRL